MATFGNNQNRRFPAFQSRDFRIWWVGQFVSTIGNQMQMVAINWQIYLLTHSAFALGLIGIMRFVPFVVCGIFAGMVVDTYNRKIANLIVQIAELAIAFALAVLTFLHHINPFAIYLLTVLYTVCWAFDVPTRFAFIPSLVKREHVSNTMSLSVILRETAFVIGPAVAGLVIAATDVGVIYIINGISYVAIIIGLFLIKHPGTIENAAGGFSLHAFKQGLHFVRTTTIIWSTTMLDFFSAFFSEATTLLPIFARDILHVGPQELGLLYAAPSAGAVMAGLYIAYHQTISRQGKLLLTAILFYALGTIAFGLSRWFPISIAALLMIGAGDSVSTILRDSIRQASTPDYLRGRMTAINMMFYMGGPQLGEFEAGVVAALVGAPLSVVIGGIATLVIVAWVAAKIPLLRNYHN